MTCLAIDDEPLALDLVEDNIRKISFLRLLKKCSNALEANEFLLRHPVDLLFLDIQMPGLSGIQFLQGLTKNPPLVILITAYEKYALDGYNFDVVDYLLKPVSFERFLKAVNKSHEKFLSISSTQGALQNYLFVNSEYSLVRIDFNDIAYIEGLRDYVKIFLLSASRPVITRISMKSLEEKLPMNSFVRVHKSFIVALNKITSIRKGRISILKAQVPISEHFKENIYKVVDPKSLN
ncbi:response regulator transcription factor [Chryseolinea sp. H1M3-3]|uniref:LytR/AlgR family response regulator transcription factor n=1 Tax=Chryseolinea sp. H1M3-3 TaxID=3034144 RepID=UPI0023EB6C1B|nr:response regulator transcription factor [Chryseolinea sp. H1M3-3]